MGSRVPWGAVAGRSLRIALWLHRWATFCTGPSARACLAGAAAAEVRRGAASVMSRALPSQGRPANRSLFSLSLRQPARGNGASDTPAVGATPLAARRFRFGARAFDLGTVRYLTGPPSLCAYVCVVKLFVCLHGNLLPQYALSRQISPPRRSDRIARDAVARCFVVSTCTETASATCEWELR